MSFGRGDDDEVGALEQCIERCRRARAHRASVSTAASSIPSQARISGAWKRRSGEAVADKADADHGAPHWSCGTVALSTRTSEIASFNALPRW